MESVSGFFLYNKLKEEYEAAAHRVEEDKRRLKESIAQLLAEIPPDRQVEVLNSLFNRQNHTTHNETIKN